MRIRNTLVLAIMAAVLVACGATTPQKSAPVAAVKALSAEDAVAQRAKERWDLLIAKQPAKAYEYLSLGTRTTTPQNAYIRRIAGSDVKWTSAEVRDIGCAEQDLCRVQVLVTYKTRSGLVGVGETESTTPVNESWLLGDDGQWYFVPESTGR